jgi:hypothetical protein
MTIPRAGTNKARLVKAKLELLAIAAEEYAASVGTAPTPDRNLLPISDELFSLIVAAREYGRAAR